MNQLAECGHLNNFLKIDGTNFSLNDEQFETIKELSSKVENSVFLLFWQFTIQTMQELDIISNQNLSIEMFLIRLIYIKGIKSNISSEKIESLDIPERLSKSFKNKEVSKEIIENILNISRFAPSGGNTQPWKIYVLSQDLMKELETSVFSNLDNGVSETQNFNIYPQPMSDHLKNRVKECGRLMYGALEIGKEDVEGRLNQLKQNFSFFGAPAGVIHFRVNIRVKSILTWTCRHPETGWHCVGQFDTNDRFDTFKSIFPRNDQSPG